MSRLFRHIILLLLPILSVPVQAQEQEVDENFVIASLLIADPGDVMYSRFGHAALHMRCPEHNLDYVFSYESEDVRDKVLSFLSGHLKMCMSAVSFEEYLTSYREEGRGVKEYDLNLPIEAKRNLWRILDERIEEGIYYDYDYLKRGCAQSILMMIKKGLTPQKITYGQWAEENDLTRREIAHKQLYDAKWTRCFLHIICNGEMDEMCSNEKKVIIPTQLVNVLSKATINGTTIISDEPVTILEHKSAPSKQHFPPIFVACILFVMSIICAFLKMTMLDCLLLIIQTAIGALTVYLVLFSNLVCTNWSWLIIPFNPLPLLLWKWREYWALPYAIICIIWAGIMVFWPHLLTDWSLIILSLSFSTSLFIKRVTNQL